ncbi:unnamed protein product [Bemisia tabaci]|uniref:C2H2-type domain-containing protein n=1 Tax=Bemisia tabaci TaxID=7038 RepID=A0AAI8Y5V5_BEMTA|nr:unnamed protein product [Bemisia tabaci]
MSEQIGDDSDSEWFKPKSGPKRNDISTCAAVPSGQNYVCKFCSKTYHIRQSFLKHLKSRSCQKPPKPSENSKPKYYICSNCDVQIGERKNFMRHAIKCKGKDEAKYTKCLEPSCPILFYKTSELMKHLNEEHMQSINIEHHKFNSVDEFNSFKNEQNIKYFMSCVDHWGSRTIKGISYSYYICNHNVKDEKKRIKKHRIPGTFCPARMMVKTDQDGKCDVRYIKDHSHEIKAANLQYNRYSKDMLDYVKVLLIKGVSPRKIKLEVTKLCLEGEYPMKDSLLDLREIRNIHYRLLRDSHLHPSDAEAVGILASRFQKEGSLLWNPLCKHIHKVHSLQVLSSHNSPNPDEAFDGECETESDELRLHSSPPKDLPPLELNTNVKFNREIIELLDDLKKDLFHDEVQKKSLPYLLNLLRQAKTVVKSVIAETVQLPCTPTMEFEKIAPNQKKTKQAVNLFRTIKTRKKNPEKSKFAFPTKEQRLTLKKSLLGLDASLKEEDIPDHIFSCWEDLTRDIFKFGENTNISILRLKSVPLNLPEGEVNKLKLITSNKFVLGWLEDEIIDAFLIISMEAFSNAMLIECWRSSSYLRLLKIFSNALLIFLSALEFFFPGSSWKIAGVPHYCQKENDSVNCGVFVCWFAARLLRGEDITSEFDEIAFRNEIIHTIVKEGLKDKNFVSPEENFENEED